MEAETEAVRQTDRQGERGTNQSQMAQAQAGGAGGAGASTEGRGEWGGRGSPAVRLGAFIEEAAGGSGPAGPGKPPGLRRCCLSAEGRKAEAPENRRLRGTARFGEREWGQA